MNTARLWLAALVLALAACGNKAAETASPAAAASPTASASAVAPALAPAANSGAAGNAPAPQPSPGESTVVAAAEADRGASGLERIAALPAAGALPAGRWVAGQHYRVLSPAQPTSASPGKVEVMEVFWYGCSHCYALEPFLQSWQKTLPQYVEFVRLPVMWDDAVRRAHARLYYTLQALGKSDALHSKVFNEIHVNQKPLAGSSDEESLALQQAFAKANGISDSDYAKAYQSFTVQNKLQQAAELTARYKVEGVPLIVINGKYVSDVGMAGSQANLISLINDLVAAEKRR